MVSLNHFLVVGAALFAIGLFGALGKRNAIAVLMSIEIMLNAVNVTLIGFSRYVTPLAAIGQAFAVFIITVAAAEAAVGLAIVLSIYRSRDLINLDDIDLLRW